MRPARRANRDIAGNGRGAKPITEPEGRPSAQAGAAEIARLRSIVAAQRWDIDGLTEQRDALLRELSERDETIAALEAQAAERHHEWLLCRDDRAALREQARRSGGVLRLATDLIDVLRPLLAASDERQSAVVFGRLLATVGAIDADHYRRHGGAEGEHADHGVHYLLRGEAADLTPNPLFDPRHYRAQVSPYEDMPSGLLVHYLVQGWRRGLSPHPLFDGDWYSWRYPEVGAECINPLLHFLRIGARIGYSPHPLFHPEYYAGRIGAGVGWNVLGLVEHFLTTGGPAGLSPSPLFDPGFYTARNPDAATDGRNPLLHYLKHGDAQDRMPNVGFDPAWYRSQLDPEEGVRGLLITHFLAYGHDRGLSPSPLFDPQFYLQANPDVQRDRKNALVHYLECGQHEPRDFHPLIDRGYFLARTRAIRPGLDCLRLLVEEPRCRGLSPTPLFDPEYYLARCPEARDAPCGAFEHYLRFGVAAGHDPHPLFCTEFYSRQVDWRSRSRDPLSDYLRFGEQERSSPHPLLDGKLYLELYEDLARDKANPLFHYVQHGGRGDERRIPHRLFDPPYFLDKLGRLPEKPHLLEFLSLPADELADPHRLFDCRYYLEQRPELRAAGLNPLLHYLTTPAGQAANPHPLFDEQFYLAQRPELAGGATPLLLHYLDCGYKERVSPHPCFDSAYVAERSPDMVKEGRVPLLDYLIHGPFREYDPAPWFDGVSYSILRQNAWPPPVNPLIHFVRLDPHFRPAPAEPALESPPQDAAPAGARARLAPDALRKAIQVMAQANGGVVRAAVPAATARDVLDSGQIGRFIETHDFHVEGGLGTGKRTRLRGVALYAVYAPAGVLAPSHRALLRALSAAGHRTVLINSTLERGREFLAAARAEADMVVLRRNGGRDFASWMATIALLFADLAAAEAWVFANDSLIGPLADFGPIGGAFAASNADVWGLTESYEQDYHVQSSFFMMRRGAFLSAAFMRYLSGYAFPEVRTEVVRQGEIGFTAAMRQAGLKIEVMVPYAEVARAWLAQAPQRRAWLDAITESKLPPTEAAMIPPRARAAFVSFAQRWFERTETTVQRGDPLNPQHQFWDTLLTRFAYPFVKRDLLALNPARVPTVPRLWEILDPASHPLVRGSLLAARPMDCVEGSVLRFTRASLDEDEAARPVRREVRPRARGRRLKPELADA